MTKEEKHNETEFENQAEEIPAEELSETEKLAEEVQRTKDELLRTMAEMENLRKRLEREKEEARKFALKSFARDIATSMDNFARAMEAKPNDAEDGVKNFVDGIVMIEKDLLGVLERHGVKKFNPLGEKFDHNLHQAMMDVEDAEKESGTVAQVMQEGYTINERLLRPALVAVVK